MLIARPNFKTIREVQPTVSFTISHLDGRLIDITSLKKKGLKCFEIQYKATGSIALQILTSALEISKKLEVADMHVVYKRGLIIIQLLSSLDQEKVEEYARQKGKFLFATCMVNRIKRNLALWKSNKEEIQRENKEFQNIQKFVLNLSENQYHFKNLILN